MFSINVLCGPKCMSISACRGGCTQGHCDRNNMPVCESVSFLRLPGPARPRPTALLRATDLPASSAGAFCRRKGWGAGTPRRRDGARRRRGDAPTQLTQRCAQDCQNTMSIDVAWRCLTQAGDQQTRHGIHKHDVGWKTTHEIPCTLPCALPC